MVAEDTQGSAQAKFWEPFHSGQRSLRGCRVSVIKAFEENVTRISVRSGLGIFIYEWKGTSWPFQGRSQAYIAMKVIICFVKDLGRLF